MMLTRFVKKGSLLLVLSLVFVSSFFCRLLSRSTEF